MVALWDAIIIPKSEAAFSTLAWILYSLERMIDFEGKIVQQIILAWLILKGK